MERRRRSTRRSRSSSRVPRSSSAGTRRGSAAKRRVAAQKRLARLERTRAPAGEEQLKLSHRRRPRAARVVLSTDRAARRLREWRAATGTAAHAGTGDRARRARGADRAERRRQDDAAAHADRRDSQPLAGKFYFGTNVRPAYYAQTPRQPGSERTALETILDEHPMTEEAARTLPGALPLHRRRCLQAGRGALRRRAQPAGAGEADAGAGELPDARRADEPPRHRRARGAGRRARRVRRHAALRLARPLLH